MPDPRADDRGPEVYSAISQLPIRLRDAVVAVDVVGLSYPQAARALHVRPVTVGARVFHARRALTRALRSRPR